MISPKINAKEFTARLKATIQSTGRLGFTSETQNQLQMTSSCSVYLAFDDTHERVMYMAMVRELREDAFPLISSGKYFYLNTGRLFKKMKYDFKKNVYMFDLERYEEGDQAMDGECYIMTRREHVRTKEDKE